MFRIQWVFLIASTVSCWSPHLENITVTRADHVHFRCPLPDRLSPKESIIQWKKWRSNDDFLVVSINGKIPQSLQRLYQSNHTSSLQLLSADRQDSTIFICESFESQTILCQYNLIVLIKPEAPLLTINRDQFEESQTVTMKCSSENGNPPPQYTWYRNGTLITPLNKQVIDEENGSIYTFNASRSDHLINYQCEIFNSALNQPIRLEQQLNVKYRPYVKILHGRTILSEQSNSTASIVVIERNSLNLTCLFDANPDPHSVFWLNNKNEILSREKTFFLPQVTSTQSGIYSCVVENTLGKRNQSIYLDVQYAPRVRSKQTSMVVNRSQSVSLRCDVDSNPSPFEIIWLKNKYEIARQNQTTEITLEHVERNHSAIYTCLAFNRFDNNQINNGSTTIELVVQTRPIIETTYSKIATELGQSLTVHCRFTAYPSPRVFWKFQEKILECHQLENELCSLQFSKISPTDFGSYQCVAENLLGREEWTFTIVSRGKPETPTNLHVSDVTASSIRVHFTPSFDGGSGSQRFFIELDAYQNRSKIRKEIFFDTNGFKIEGLNESTSYEVRLQSSNSYGESPWTKSVEVQTLEFTINSDDLPQLHAISYHPKEQTLSFDYLPLSSLSKSLSDAQLCLNIRHSTDGKLYQKAETCLPIVQRRVRWQIVEQFPYLKLSICSKKRSYVCGSEVEMKEEWNYRNVGPVILGIIVTTGFLILLIAVMIVMLCSRSRQDLSKANRIKLDIDDPDHDFKRMIQQRRSQNPYDFSNNSNRRSSLYDFSLHDYHQQATGSSFAVQPDSGRDDGQTSCSYAVIDRVNVGNRQSVESRSNSHPSSEASCATQNSNFILPTIEINSKGNSLSVAHYGFPSMGTRCPNKQSPFSFDRLSMSSEQSSVEQRKKSYEIMV